MCGIWGLLSTLRKMDLTSVFQSIHYTDCMSVQPRGPERTIIKQSNHYMLGFHRLAINGLSEDNDQPYLYEEEESKYIVMCNGEIYNFDKIKVILGLGDEVTCDTRVVYPLFKLLNYDFQLLNQTLQGEYALVIIKSTLQGSIQCLYASVDECSVRPLFYAYDQQSGVFAFSSLLRGICNSLSPQVHPVRMNGGQMIQVDFATQSLRSTSYVDWNIPQTTHTVDEIKKQVVECLEACVHRRLKSDRNIGCFLSGGLDSSLIAALLAVELKKDGKQLHTFSIGAEDSADVQHALLVANHIHSKHTHVSFSSQQGLQHLDEVIHACETFDITTIRASIGQYLISKYIAQHTDIKVVFSGDGADEAEMGYLYFLKAPTPADAQKESLKLLREIHLYDGLRVDRCVSINGLEARVPYLDWEFVQSMLSIPPELKVPIKGERVEKWLLRSAFDELRPGLLPDRVLWRTKETFSDSLSTDKSSWYQELHHYMINHGPNRGLMNELCKTDHCPPQTVEAGYYRLKFNAKFGIHAAAVIPHIWMPMWSNTTDPSARTLEVYEDAQNKSLNPI